LAEKKVVADLPSWKRRKPQPRVIDGMSASRMILEERDAALSSSLRSAA
jgi:hypothetical protein